MILKDLYPFGVIAYGFRLIIPARVCFTVRNTRLYRAFSGSAYQGGVGQSDWRSLLG